MHSAYELLIPEELEDIDLCWSQLAGFSTRLIFLDKKYIMYMYIRNQVFVCVYHLFLPSYFFSKFFNCSTWFPQNYSRNFIFPVMLDFNLEANQIEFRRHQDTSAEEIANVLCVGWPRLRWIYVKHSRFERTEWLQNILKMYQDMDQQVYNTF